MFGLARTLTPLISLNVTAMSPASVPVGVIGAVRDVAGAISQICVGNIGSAKFTSFCRHGSTVMPCAIMSPRTAVVPVIVTSLPARLNVSPVTSE